MIATKVRHRLELGAGPVDSMRDLFATRLPDVTVLYAHLCNDKVSGVSFVDAARGPAVVLNLGGKNRNPPVRRFSLAHELCHLLFDWNRQHPLGQLSGFYDEAALAAERRANAFALRFLCPERHFRRVAAAEDVSAEARRLMADFGLHYRACALALDKIAGVHWEVSPVELAASPALAKWIEREEPHGLVGFPMVDVPPERRTVVASLAALAWSRGLIQRDRFARSLGVPPTREIESVVDFNGHDLPGG
jgi:Zn-dependent peptidase ImmA (M78 family)